MTSQGRIQLYCDSGHGVQQTLPHQVALRQHMAEARPDQLCKNGSTRCPNVFLAVLRSRYPNVLLAVLRLCLYRRKSSSGQHLFHLLEVLGSDFSPKTGCPDSAFPQSFQANTRAYTALGYATTAFFHSLSNSLFTNCPIIRRYTIQAADSIVK